MGGHTSPCSRILTAIPYRSPKSTGESTSPPALPGEGNVEKNMLDILLFVSFAIGVPWCIWFTLGFKSGTMAAMLAPGLVAAGLMLTISPLKLGNSPLVRFGEPKYALLAWCVPVAWVVALAGLNLLLRTGSLWPPHLSPHLEPHQPRRAG